MAGFNLNDVPDLSGKVVLITGANSGLGLETAKMVAGKGARVIMACRNEQKAQDAASLIRDAAPNAAIDIRQIDLADLSSVAAFCDGILANESKIDLLINNAGLSSDARRETADGFEMHFGANHLGHFAMNAKLLPLVEAAGGRIVGLGSASHKMVKENTLQDVNWQKRKYAELKAYAESKLANMLYIRELAKRLQAKNSPAMAVMAHPGFASTNIVNTEDTGLAAMMRQLIVSMGMALLAQSARAGAMPTIMAATDPDAQPGDYYGPQGFGEWRGAPGKCNPAPIAQDDANAKALWDLSEEMTGVKFAI